MPGAAGSASACATDAALSVTTRAADREASRWSLRPQRFQLSRLTGPRIFVTGVCLALGLGTLIGGVYHIPWSHGQVLPCAILTNGTIGSASNWDRACELEGGEQIVGLVGPGGAIRPIADRQELVAAIPQDATRITVQARRGLRVQLRDMRVRHLDAPTQAIALLVPSAFALALVAFGLVILWSSPAPAAPPLALVCASFAMVLVSGGTRSAGMYPDIPWAFAQGMIPASLLHLALNTPLHSAAVERLRVLVPAIYAFGGGIIVGQLNAIMRFETWWSFGDVASLTMLAIGLVAVVGTSLFSIRESPTKRGRARAVALLCITVALVAVALLIPVAAPPFAEAALQRATGPLLFVLLTAAIYLACRFAVVEIPLSLRWLAAYPFTAAIAASAVTLFAPFVAGSPVFEKMLSEPTTLFATCFGVVVVLDTVSRLMRRLLGGVMGGSDRLEAAQESLAAALAATDHTDAVARLLVESSCSALRIPRAALFLPLSDGRWRLAAARGNVALGDDIAARAHDVADRARRALGNAGALVVPLERALDQLLGGLVDELVDAGIEAIVLLPAAEGTAGLLLVDAPSGADLISSYELRFLEQLATQGGLALTNARLRERLVAQGRDVAAGQVAAGIAHDLGRPLGEIFIEARALKRATGDPGPGLETIQELAEECMKRLETLTRPGTSPADEARGALDEVIGAAAARIAKLSHGRPPVLRPAAGSVVVPEPRSVQRVIENVLENAYRWGGAEATVEVRTERCGDDVLVEVIDDGTGMEEAIRQRALDPRYSGADGTGLGLAICRDVVGRLGGSLSIESGKDAGTRVRITLPAEFGPS
jgi:signal transduction histidine kinase